jgi:hypothetical protein
MLILRSVISPFATAIAATDRLPASAPAIASLHVPGPGTFTTALYIPGPGTFITALHIPGPGTFITELYIPGPGTILSSVPIVPSLAGSVSLTAVSIAAMIPTLLSDPVFMFRMAPIHKISRITTVAYRLLIVTIPE